MSATRRSIASLAVMIAVVLGGFALWLTHAKAWDLGRGSAVLNNDSAQYALAARELAEHGRLATTYALPVELAGTRRPPWPLAVIQPGLVLLEAAIFRVSPRVIHIGDVFTFYLQVPHQREWLTLLVPFFCYLMLGSMMALASGRLLDRYAPQTTLLERRLAGLTVGFAFLLDPEAQRLAAGGVPDLPFALAIAGIITALASEYAASRRPLLFGVLLGIAGSFVAGMVWFLPVFLIAAIVVSPERRARVAMLAVLGYLVVAAPWWYYKWRVFGSPSWDLSHLVLWDGIQGRNWFALAHLPETPALPRGSAALGLLAMKTASHISELLLEFASGPRLLWTGALFLWVISARPPRRLAVASWAMLALLLLGLVGAAATVSWLRPVFAIRIVIEAAGVMALWGLISAAPPALMGPAFSRTLRVGVAMLAIGWGAYQTARGNAVARDAASAHETPTVLTLRDLVYRMRQRIPAGETVMSNLGPTLSWYSGRPVIHLALSPGDVPACRQRAEFRHIVLAFRDSDQAWVAWREIFDHPADAVHNPEWNVVHERHWQELDGFQVVWLELGPRRGETGAALGRLQRRATLSSGPIPPRSCTLTRRASAYSPRNR
jgi:hypothetical protein